MQSTTTARSHSATLRLRSAKLDQLEQTMSVMLAPLDHDDEGEWLSAVNRSVATLFNATGVLSLVADATGHATFRFHDTDPVVAQTLQEIPIGAGQGTLHFRYPGLSKMMRRLAVARVQVWTPELAERITRIPIENLRFTHEVVEPYGIGHQANLAIPLPDGIAQIGFYHDSPARDPFGDDRIALLHLLRPAFRSGVRAIRRSRARRHAMAELLDADSAAVLIFDHEGQPVHRNRAATTLLGDENRSELLREAQALALRVRALRASPRKSDPEPPRIVGDRTVAGDDGSFRLSATCLPPGVIGRNWTCAVRVERTTPVLPSVEEISERFGLTPRQAEVARLIAGDRGSTQIAEHLGISVHTVRRHAEQILPRLGIRSRKGIAPLLLAHPPHNH